MTDNLDGATLWNTVKRSISKNYVFCLVGGVALVTNVLSLLSTPLWVYPDSIDYIQLATGLADRFDVENELYLIRTPGYPVFLAAIFLLAGSASPVVIQIVHHGMAAATAVIVAWIGWRISANRFVALLAGILSALSLQILTYANLALTETPFMLVLCACVGLLIRFHQEGNRRDLAFVSLFAGVGYLIRPVGMYLLAITSACAVWRLWQERRTGKSVGAEWDGRPRLRFARLLGATGFAIVPAALVMTPWMAISAYYHGGTQADRCLDYMYYLRAATFDGLDSTASPAMREIHAVIGEAVDMGHLPATADYRDRATVIRAYQAVRGATFAESSAILGRAGLDLMKEHWPDIAVGTVKYAVWLLIAPDPAYRFVPGGAPGIEGRRNGTADLFDIGTYAFGPGSWEWLLNDSRHYLPLASDHRPITEVGKGIASNFLNRVERGPAVLGVGDSLYEELMILCLFAGGATMLTRARGPWFIVGAVVASHVLISAFLSGSQTRYALPVKPFLMLYAAFGLVILGSAMKRMARAAASSVIANSRVDGQGAVASRLSGAAS